MNHYALCNSRFLSLFYSAARSLMVSEEVSRSVFNLVHKKILSKNISSIVSALYLLKKTFFLTDAMLLFFLSYRYSIDRKTLKNQISSIRSSYEIRSGKYILYNNIIDPSTGNKSCWAGSVVLLEKTTPIGYVLNTPIYEVYHYKIDRYVYVCSGDLTFDTYGNSRQK